MLVKERMTINPVTVKEDTSMHDALRLMRERKISRLPVLNKAGKLVGMVSEKDLLYASPSPATTLSVFEVNYLISQIKITQLMTRDVITIEDDCPLEEAARIMVDNDISGLPVMHKGALVGIIVETDLFKIFLELLGARTKALRLSLRVPEKKGELAALTQTIAGLGGDIVALGTFTGETPDKRGITLKVRDVDREVLVKALTAAGAEVVDVREA
jgi:acetoin utilization protein AcuB